jgi:Spy/CpxP family protein refolding chaperone
MINPMTLKRLTLKHLLSASILAVSLPMANIALAHDGHQGGAHCERGHYSQHEQHHGFKHHGLGHHASKDGVPHYLHGLELTQTQKDQLFALRHEQAPILREQQKQRHALHQALRETSQAQAFDDAKAQEIASGLANLERDQLLMRARTQARILALITPQQREKAQAFNAAHAKGERTRFKFHDGHQQHHQHRKM